jgi:hypothetical protein
LENKINVHCLTECEVGRKEKIVHPPQREDGGKNSK